MLTPSCASVESPEGLGDPTESDRSLTNKWYVDPPARSSVCCGEVGRFPYQANDGE
jgi:hypothetical protein